MSAFCPVAQLKRIVGEKDFPSELECPDDYLILSVTSGEFLLPKDAFQFNSLNYPWLSKASLLSCFEIEDLTRELSWSTATRDYLPLWLHHQLDGAITGHPELIEGALNRGEIKLFRIRKPAKSHAPAKKSVLDLVDELPAPPAQTGIPKPKTPTHWIEFCYQYQDDKKPISQVPFVLTLPDGSEINGTLPDNGSVRIEDIKQPGEASIVYGDESAEQKVSELRREIKQALDTIIQEEQKEAAEIEDWYEDQNFIDRFYIRQFYFGKGIVNGAWGLLQWVGNVTDAVSQFGVLDSMIQAAWQQEYDYQNDRWKDEFLKNFSEEHKKKVVKAIGFDPESLTRENLAEAYEVYTLIKSDPESKQIIWDFIKDYVDAQHELELTEAGGELGFEFIFAAILAAFTGGTGAATLAPRLASKMPKLGQLFRRLGIALKKLKLRKKAKGNTNKPTTVEVKKPEKSKLEAKKPTPEQLATAKKLGVDPKWVDADGKLIYPPNNGVIGDTVVKKLDKGTIIDRYGRSTGRYFSPDGIPFEQRALPSSALKQDYTRYEVLKPFDVEAGEIAPWFDQPGGGMQFYSKELSAKDLIKKGYVRVVQ